MPHERNGGRAMPVTDAILLAVAWVALGIYIKKTNQNGGNV